MAAFNATENIPKESDGNGHSLPDRLCEPKVNKESDDPESERQADEEKSSKATDNTSDDARSAEASGSSRNCDNVEKAKVSQEMVVPPTDDLICSKSNNESINKILKKNHSENLVSRNVLTSTKPLSSHWLDVSLPSYALPTVASQIRLSLALENVSIEDIPVCSRYNTPSPVCHRHKRHRSRSAENGLETESALKSERCYSAQPWRSNAARVKNRPSSATKVVLTPTRPKILDNGATLTRSDSYVRGSGIRSLIGNQKISSKSSQFSADGSKSDVLQSAKDMTEKTNDRPSVVSCKDISLSNNSSFKSKRPTERIRTKVSPEPVTALEKQPLLNSKPDTKVSLIHGSRRADKNGQEQIMDSNKSIVSVIAPTVSQTSKKITSPVNDSTKKFAEDINFPAFKEKGLKLDRGKGIVKEHKGKAKLATEAVSDRDRSANKDANESMKTDADILPTNEHVKGSVTMHDKATVQNRMFTMKPVQGRGASDKKEQRQSLNLVRGSGMTGNKESLGKLCSDRDPDQKHLPARKSVSDENVKPKEAERASGTGEAANIMPKEGAGMEEYRAKLAEKRKLAREKADLEAEQERLRQEQIRQEEEENRLRQEEEERRRDEEEIRLAEESRRLEEERYKKSVEEAELHRREEAARIEAEAKAKMEQELLARQETERLENERIEKKKREEEEKLVRKKRLEAIMRRVKTEEQVTKADSKSVASPVLLSDNQPDSKEQSGCPSDLVTEDQKEMATTQALPADEGVKRFKSPLLQQLLTGRAKTQTIAVSNFLSADTQSLNDDGEETANCLFEEPKKTDETSRVVLSQEMIS